jgi:RNA polymerase sigma-70 factor (ECF subfamily)
MQPAPSDEVLAHKAKEGDRAAFEELFERYKDPILNFVYRLIGNRETAKEVTQDVFLRVYRNLDIFDPDKKFAVWIYMIARNMAKNALRDKKYFRDVSLEQTVSERGRAVKVEDTLADPRSAPDAAAETGELEDRVQKALDSIPLKYKEVVTMHYIMGITKEEIARIMKRSMVTIKWRLRKGRMLLMRKMSTRSSGD